MSLPLLDMIYEPVVFISLFIFNYLKEARRKRDYLINGVE